MRYQNTKTGFVFDSKSEIKAEGWVKLDPQPISKTDTEPKKKSTKRVK